WLLPSRRSSPWQWLQPAETKTLWRQGESRGNGVSSIPVTTRAGRTGHKLQGLCPDREEEKIGGHDCHRSHASKRLAGAVGVRELLGHGGRSKGDDQGDGEEDLLHRCISFNGVGRLIWYLPAGHFSDRHQLCGHRARICPIARGYDFGAFGAGLGR